MAKKAYIGIGGVAKEIKTGYIGVDGVARKMKSGYIGVNGVARQCLSAGVPLSVIEEGGVVVLNENGVPVEFYVAKHNYESELNGNGRTLLVRKTLYVNCVWSVDEDNDYGVSTIDTFLNSDYLALFDANTRAAIGTTTFYYDSGSGQNPKSPTRAVFLLSCTELGGTGSYYEVEGTKLPTSSLLKIAYTSDGTATTWWTRSHYNRNNKNAYYVSATGTFLNRSTENEYCARPAFTLPETTIVDPNTGVVAL